MNDKIENMKLPVVLGKNDKGEIITKDLVDYCHILIGGISGQGKTTCINTIVTSLLKEKTPDEVKFIFASCFKMQLSPFEDLNKEFIVQRPNQNEKILQDFDDVMEMLKWLHEEMDNRYELLKNASSSKFEDINQPRIVCIIDEYADYIMMDDEFEKEIRFIAPLCAQVGIHLILTTMRPTDNIVTPTIRVHIPMHIAFKVYDEECSRVLLCKNGAEYLTGPGDMLISFDDETMHLQGIFIEDDELGNIIKKH